MAVYTWVNPTQLASFLESYEVGQLLDYRGIRQGVENSNFFVSTESGEFILTLFERQDPADLPYFLELMAFLAQHGLPAPQPQARQGGHYLSELNGRPAAVVQRLPGGSVEHPSTAQTRAIADALGQMHAAVATFPRYRDNPRGPHWWRQILSELDPVISPEDRQLAHDELKFQGLYRMHDLPRGTVHADLFRDNALFEADQLTGIIDFYYACTDVYLFDVAVTVNDWCSDAHGSLDLDAVADFLRTYAVQRPLQAIERGAWPVMLRAAAFRFWLSRLYDQHFPRPGEITHVKDPDVYKRILQDRQRNHATFQRRWTQIRHHPSG